MAQKILVVDRNEAFAAMLQGMLETDGGYQVEVAYAGSEALTLLQREALDLTIVDMDLDPDEMDYRSLISAVRHIRPAMRLMLIPLMGEDLPAEASRLDIQGTLSKPFFADDLLPRIQAALESQVDVSPPAPPGPERAEEDPAEFPASPALPETTAPDVRAVLQDLARETRADVILLVSAQPENEQLVAEYTVMERLDLAELAGLSIATVQTAQATSQILGQPDEPFVHNMFESKTLRLYIMAMPEDLLVVIVAPISTPLGTVRHNLRRASRDLAGLSLT